MSRDQRSLSEQLDYLRQLAREAGLFAAEDWLVRTRRWLEESDNPAASVGAWEPDEETR